MRASRVQTDREMNDGQSTTPSLEGESSGNDDAGGAESQPSRSFLTRLFHRASSALTSDSETDAQLRAALGPAFRNTTPAELAMVMNILRLRERRVLDVMTTRADIVAVEADANLAAVIAAFERGSLSRRNVVWTLLSYIDTKLTPANGCRIQQLKVVATLPTLLSTLCNKPSMRCLFRGECAGAHPQQNLFAQYTGWFCYMAKPLSTVVCLALPPVINQEDIVFMHPGRSR